MSPIIIWSGIEKYSHNTNYNANNKENAVHEDYIYLNDSEKIVCTIKWPENRNNFPADMAFVIYSIVVSFLIPFIIISVFYVKIVNFLSERAKFRKIAHINASNDIHRKVTTLVLTLVGVYLICFTPFWINQIILIAYFTVTKSEYQSEYFYQISARLSSIFQIIICLNSAINPFLYAFLSEKFREEFKKNFNNLGPKFSLIDQRKNTRAFSLKNSTLIEIDQL